MKRKPNSCFLNSVRHLLIPLMVSMICLLFFSPAWAKGRKPLQVEFSVLPSTVTAGNTLAVWYRANKPLKNTALYFNERKSYFYSKGENNWRALVGIDSMEPPGKKHALFYAELHKGRVFQSTITFTVAAGDYPSGHVRLTPALEALIKSGKVRRDSKNLRDIYTVHNLEEKLWSGYFVMPTTGIVSSVFGARRLYGKGKRRTAHSGTDIANEAGTLIVAPNRARVAYVGGLETLGHCVLLDHGQDVFTYYLHMEKTLVEAGAMIEQNTPIGLMGAEGIATGPHLHWSLAIAGQRVNPMEWIERSFD